MRKIFTSMIAALAITAASAQTDVTSTYMQNPDFEARYAGWVNEGSTQGAVGGFQHQESTAFAIKNGDMNMEKWVSSGSKVGNCHIRQTLRNLPVGTYTITVAAQNIQQSDTTAVQTGAYVYADTDTTQVSAAQDYSVTFTVLDGEATVGFRTESCTGNFVCLDNFRLTLADEVDMDGAHNELQKLIDAANEAVGEGTADDELQSAITTAQSLLTATSADGMQDAAIALKQATMNYKINNATGNTPKVVTNTFVAMGSTIALGRSTITNNGSTLQESGFCWSTTNMEPTILDDHSSDYFTNNGKVYRMEGLEPATMYYVRPYALTTGNRVAYGDVVRIATTPAGTVSYGYNDGGSTDENKRIRSAIEETVWMYNHLTNIQGVYLNVNYGASTATADCSYGGYMRVGPSTSYQQTGTLLHETNHGVGVGTHWVWYENASLRSNTTSGKWLGPQATDMVQFISNNDGAYIQGDATHMWGGTTSSSSAGLKNFGINGASEDSYSPADQLLYWSNVLITHSLHVDGLPYSWSKGFATQAYVLEQYDNQKYYIKSEVDEYGEGTFLSHNKSGTLRQISASMTEALSNDSLAWYINFNPATGYYTMQNAGSGRYIGLSSSKLAAVTSSAQALQMFPSREKITKGDMTKHSYWITASDGTYALKAGTTSVATATYDNSADADAQRWLIMDESELGEYDSELQSDLLSELKTLIKNVRTLAETEHEAQDATLDLDSIDNALETTLATIEDEMGDYADAAEVSDAITTVEEAMTSFLGAVNPTDLANPFELTFLIDNASITSNEGWSDTPTYDNSVCSYTTAAAWDFYQTIGIKMPIGTYKFMAQCFQRPGTQDDAWADWQDSVNNVKAQLYIKTKTTTVKNIFEDSYTRSLGTGSVEVADGIWIPSTTSCARYFFNRDLYDNEVMVTTTSAATIKVGLKCAAVSSSYWTAFDNFRLYYYGNIDQETVTPVEEVTAAEDVTEGDGKLYDLQGRPATRMSKGILIRNGKKVVF